MKKIQKFLEKVVNIIMALIVIAICFCVYNIVAVKIFNKSYVNIFGYTFFEVATGSMAGSIEIGDAVIVKINDDVKVGDIVTYLAGDDYITHRIISIEKDEIITKGDANNTNDNPITKKDILGRVIKIVPNVSTWKNVLLTPKVIILVFVTLISFSLLFSYSGSTIKISMADQEREGYSKRRNRDSKKTLEATQIINLNDLNQKIEAKHQEGKRKKVLEATQIINLDEFDDYRNKREKE